MVVASDKFKGSLTSNQVAVAVGEGVRRVCPDATVDAVPVADGGDGTLAAAVAAGFEFVPVTASGPTGEPVRTGYARRRGSADGTGSGGDVAVVELADVSGLVRLPGGRPAPMTATSRGTGELMAAAIDSGCTRIIVGIGGSASTDGGAGLLRALGAKLYDATGNELSEGGAALSELASVDLTALTKRLADVEVIVACDVDNPLTGPTGAAAVYAPQKGANPTQVEHLDAALSHWADHVAAARARRDAPGYPHFSRVPTAYNPWEPTRTGGPPGSAAGQPGADLREVEGAGAAGGVGFAALALLGAELRPGIELMLELVGFRRQLAGAGLVITGEGALDEQTLHGKAVAGVAAAAGAVGVPVVAVCGSNRLDPDRLRQAGVAAAYALTDLEADVRRCIAEPVPLLRQLGERIAADHLPRSTMTSTERGIT